MRECAAQESATSHFTDYHRPKRSIWRPPRARGTRWASTRPGGVPVGTSHTGMLGAPKPAISGAQLGQVRGGMTTQVATTAPPVLFGAPQVPMGPMGCVHAQWTAWNGLEWPFPFPYLSA